MTDITDIRFLSMCIKIVVSLNISPYLLSLFGAPETDFFNNS
jgi:hypothetical protein